MSHKKVALKLIANNAARRATFKKRRKGLMKKANELATLCDIQARFMVYGNGKEQPGVWPSVAEAKNILARFKSMPELDQCNKKMDQDGVLCKHIGKLREHIYKAERKNHERATTALRLEALLGHHPGLVDITIEELISLVQMMEMCLNKVIETIQQRRAQKAPVLAPVLQSLTYQIQMAATNTTANNMDYIIRGGLMYQALPPQERSSLDEVKTSGGDLGTLVNSGFADGNCNGASPSFTHSM